ncbi:hypothetical protein CPB84DRAFT_1780259 [Gymnopilus junonius]|uniref:Protein mms22 n=1 Tax=Gymnopilus junonius TaxID=109634 RepID=A0A9P5NJX0_GYMJU|nr:hypothetical protein CPB84DRAFT_1780259 [Gymnopilus junonius]
MDFDDEVVETSDLEELEELEATRRTKASRPLEVRDFNVDILQGSPPRKKIKLYHESPNDETNELFVSPAKSVSVDISTPNKSQSSSTMLGTASSPQLANSRSSTQTPGSTRNVSLIKLDDNVLAPKPSLSTAIDTYSQDPLLLEPPANPGFSFSPGSSQVGTIVPFLYSENSRTATPVNSPPGPRVRFPSLDPLYLFGISPPPSPTPVTGHPLREDPVKDGFDELRMFSPVKAVSQDGTSSPLTPLSPKSPRQPSPTSPTSESHRDSSSLVLTRASSPDGQGSRSPSPAVDAVARHDTDLRLAQAVHEEQTRKGAYSLRTRNTAQINPYTYDRLKYKRLLQHNPDAIVNDKLLDRRRHHHPDDHYEEEGTQQEGYTLEGDDEGEDDESWAEQQRRRQRREEKRRRNEEARQGAAGQGQGSVQYPGILQEDLSATDEEVEKEMRTLSKEGRRLLKEQEKQRKAQEKEERRQRREEELRRAKRFPNPGRSTVHSKPPNSARHSGQLSANNENRDHEVIVVEDSPHTRSVPSQAGRSSSNQADLLRDYFADDDEFGMHDQGGSTQHSLEATSPQISPSELPKGSLGRTYGTIIEVGPEDDVGAKPAPEPYSREKDAESSSSQPDFHVRALKKMLPMFMINRIKKNKPGSSEEDDDGDENRPLLPGQTRVRHAVKPKGNEEIRGDPESDLDLGESSDSSSSSDSELPELLLKDEDSDVDDILTAYGRQTKRKPSEPQIIDVDDYDDDHSDDDREIQIISIQKAAKKGATSRRRDPSMIDYMLARPSAFEAIRKPSKSRGVSGSADFRLNIVTRGAKRYGQGRQTLLSFDNHRKGGNRTPRNKSGTKAKRKAPDGHRSTQGNDSNKRRRAESRKKRREAKIKERIWTKKSENRWIESGVVRKTAFASVLENAEFHRALAPSLASASARSLIRLQTPNTPLVASASSLKSQDDGDDSYSLLTSNNTDKERWIDVPSDFKIDPLPSGTSFAITTYIRKGWLNELTNVAFSNQEPTQPSSVTLFGFMLEPTMGAEKLSVMIPRVCSSFYDFGTRLPSPDDEMESVQWSAMTHFLSQWISWYLKNGTEQEIHALRNVIETEITRVVHQLREVSVNSVQTPLLTLCWFAVELSVKTNIQSVALTVEGRPRGLLKDTTTVLMRLLVQYGLDKAMEPFGPHATSIDFSPPSFVAELWVRLIHLLGRCTPAGETNIRKNHPFWLTLVDALDLYIQTNDTTMSSFEISELIWRTIYTMCAFSQFSVHGMTTGQTHLPACWDVNYQTPKGALLRRDIDRYVALVVNRCFIVRERWHWKLTDATPMFNRLVEIFRSRKFANLSHEQCDYPKFLKEGNWDLLSVYDHRDTAFTIYLKLISQAILEDKLFAEGKPSPKVKKLLSMSVPMSALPFSKTNPPKDEDLPKKGDRKGRLTPPAIIFPSFDADKKCRIAIINGVASWAKLMVSRGQSLKDIGEWILELAKIIRTEFEAALQTDGKSSSPNIRFTKFLVDALLCQVRNIVLSHIQDSRYPDPVLFSSLEPILKSLKIVRRKDLNEFGHFTSALFDARAEALPPPFSQDYGAMDLDLDNLDWLATDLPDALVVPADRKVESEDESIEVKESKLRSLFTAVQFQWHVYYFVKGYMKPPLPGTNTADHTNECDFWIRLWLCCACVECPTGDVKKWSRYYDLLQDLFPKANEHPFDERWARRVNLSIMFQALKLRPMSYLNMMDEALQAFIHALASDNNTNLEGRPREGAIEREYVAFMLSIDCLQHPLFSNVEHLLPPRDQESGDYKFSPEEFLALRVPLLGAIFENLNNLLRKQLEGKLDVAFDVDGHIEFCKKMFSAMRYSLSKCDKSSAKYLADNDFCQQVLDALKKNPELCNQQAFEFFVQHWPYDLIPPRANVL